MHPVNGSGGEPWQEGQDGLGLEVILHRDVPWVKVLEGSQCPPAVGAGRESLVHSESHRRAGVWGERECATGSHCKRKQG